MDSPDQINQRVDQLLKDIEDLKEIHRLSNEVSANLHTVFGMTPITKTALEVFYKLRIKILEMALREWDILKNSDPAIMYNPDEITRFQERFEEWERAIAIWDHFQKTGELNEED